MSNNTYTIKTSSTVADLLDEGIIDSIQQLYTAKESGKKAGKASKDSGTYELLVPVPANVDEMNAFMKHVISESPAGTIFKTNLILETIFGKGKVPSPGTAGRDVMENLWHLVSPNWKDLVKEGFVMKGDKRGQYLGDAIEIENYLEMVGDLEDAAQENIPGELVDEDAQLADFVEDTIDETQDETKQWLESLSDAEMAELGDDLSGLSFDELD